MGDFFYNFLPMDSNNNWVSSLGYGIKEVSEQEITLNIFWTRITKYSLHVVFEEDGWMKEGSQELWFENLAENLSILNVSTRRDD